MSGNSKERLVRANAVIALRADLLTVRVTDPLPPGSRVRLQLALADGPDRPTPSGKVVGLERAQNGEYALHVRLHSLARRERAALEALVDGRSTVTGSR